MNSRKRSRSPEPTEAEDLEPKKAKLDEAKPDEAKPDEAKPDEAKPATSALSPRKRSRSPEPTEAEDPEPKKAKLDEAKPDEAKSDEAKPDEAKSATTATIARPPSWVDDPDISMHYDQHIGNSITVRNYMQFSALPLLVPKNLENTLNNGSVLKTILSFATIFDKHSNSNTILIKLNAAPISPTHEGPDDIARCQNVYPLLELKLPPEDKPDAPITFRFQVPTCAWSPIPGTALLFAENQKIQQEALKNAPGITPPPITKGRHALYRMLLPTALQAIPFADGALVPNLLAPETSENPARWRTMNLPRLRGDELNIAVAFREKLASMQRASYFSRFTFEQMVQWLNKCINQWCKQLEQQEKNKRIQQSSASAAVSAPATDRSVSAPAPAPVSAPAAAPAPAPAPAPASASASASASATTTATATATATASSSILVPAASAVLDEVPAPTPTLLPVEDMASYKHQLDTLFEVPSHWTLHRSPYSVEKIYLGPGKESTRDEFKRVMNWLRPGLPFADVHSVFRIQNGKRWDHYQFELREYCRGMAPNESQTQEKWLWHGTTTERADAIVSQGFDMRLTRPPHLWGRGTYFSTRPDYVHHYSKADSQGRRTMFLARVLVGRSTVGRSDLVRPPRIPQHSALPPAVSTTPADLSDPAISRSVVLEDKKGDGDLQQKPSDPAAVSTTPVNLSDPAISRSVVLEDKKGDGDLQQKPSDPAMLTSVPVEDEKSEDDKPQIPLPEFYTSTTDDSIPPSMYVVYDNNCSYPVYLLNYSLDPAAVAAHVVSSSSSTQPITSGLQPLGLLASSTGSGLAPPQQATTLSINTDPAAAPALVVSSSTSTQSITLGLQPLGLLASSTGSGLAPLQQATTDDPAAAPVAVSSPTSARPVTSGLQTFGLLASSTGSGSTSPQQTTTLSSELSSPGSFNKGSGSF